MGELTPRFVRLFVCGLDPNQLLPHPWTNRATGSAQQAISSAFPSLCLRLRCSPLSMCSWQRPWPVWVGATLSSWQAYDVLPCLDAVCVGSTSGTSHTVWRGFLVCRSWKFHLAAMGLWMTSPCLGIAGEASMPNTDCALGVISSAFPPPGLSSVGLPCLGEGGGQIGLQGWQNTPHLRTWLAPRWVSLVRLGSAVEQSCRTGLLPGCCRQGLGLPCSWVSVFAGPSLFPPSRPIPSGWALQIPLQSWWDNTGVVALTKQLTLLGWGQGALNVAHELAVSTGGTVLARRQPLPLPCQCVCRPLWGACVGGCLGLTLCCRMLSGALLVAMLLRAEQSWMTCLPTLLILLSLTLEMCDFYKKRPILLIIKCDKLTGSRAKESGPATSSNQTSWIVRVPLLKRRCLGCGGWDLGESDRHAQLVMGTSPPPTPRLLSVQEFSLSHTALLFQIKLPI